MSTFFRPTATDTLRHIQDILDHFQVQDGHPLSPLDEDPAMRLIAEAVFGWSLSRMDTSYPLRVADQRQRRKADRDQRQNSSQISM